MIQVIYKVKNLANRKASQGFLVLPSSAGHPLIPGSLGKRNSATLIPCPSMRKLDVRGVVTAVESMNGERRLFFLEKEVFVF